VGPNVIYLRYLTNWNIKIIFNPEWNRSDGPTQGITLSVLSEFLVKNYINLIPEEDTYLAGCKAGDHCLPMHVTAISILI
jgi:hypothetical protein